MGSSGTPVSRLTGDAWDGWPLSTAVDSLGESARKAGKPGWIWVAGIYYPSLNLSFIVLGYLVVLLNAATDIDLGQAVEFSVRMPYFINVASGGGVTLVPLLGVLLAPILFRLTVGLASIATPRQWERESGERACPPLSAAWRSGRGATLSAFGLWGAVQFLTLAAVVVISGPVVVFLNAAGVESINPVLVLALIPICFLLIVYGVVLQVVNLLALHSLARNRRGVASALTHAWRLMRNDPWSVVRASMVDLVLSISVFVLAWLLVIVAVPLSFCLIGIPLLLLGPWALQGFAGVTRACYWARAYRSLGGLAPDDVVPGLEPAEAGE